MEKKKTKLNKYAISYIPSKKKFLVEKMSQGDKVAKKYLKSVSVIRAKTSLQALKTLSKRSYKQETGRTL